MLMKSLIAAGALGAALFAFQPQAEAGPRIGIHVGIGHPHHGILVHGRRYHRPYRHWRYRCNWSAPRVKRKLRRHGYRHFRHMRYRNCRWNVRARKHGRVYRLRVSARSGRIIARARLY